MRNIKPANLIFLLFILFLGGLVFWATIIRTGALQSWFDKVSYGLTPHEQVTIDIVYAPEMKEFMPAFINEFNDKYAQGINAITGQRLKKDEKQIIVKGVDGSSGTVMQGIVNAYQNVKSDNVVKPTIFAPSVSHWLRLANYQANAQIFNLDEARATANAPVVMAIWESRLKAIQQKEGKQEVGWEELLRVLNSPNGWNDYGFSGRKTVYYGHTDPYISSTALSTLIQEFTASTRLVSGKSDLQRVTAAQVNDPKVQAQVRAIEQLIKHYSSRTTEFKEYIAQGPNYVDFVALEENDLIYINQGKTQYKPTEKLVAMYPKEGTFMHEHPFAIVNADWVNDSQKAAAKVFTDFILTPNIQKQIMQYGFRPANTEVTLEYPIVSDLGVDPAQPKKILQVPEPSVVAAVQQSWSFVKKRAELYVLLDRSGSMAGAKITSAKLAVKEFIIKLPAENSAGLFSFSDKVAESVPLASLETNSARLQTGVGEILADGTTALYDGLSETLKKLTANPSNSIKAIVLLSDGQDTSSKTTLNTLINEITASQNSDNPVLIIPIAYGSDADINALNSIARASSTRVLSGDTADINTILQVVSSYF
jgi:Ca-activated chloride channel homolog